MGPGPTPPHPPLPHTGSISCLHTDLPHGGVPSPPPEHSSTQNITVSLRGSPHTPAVSPHPLGGTQLGGEGRGLKFGGGGSCKPPHGCNQSNQSQLPASCRTGVRSPFCASGATGGAGANIPPPKTPPRTGSPPFPCFPLHPTTSGLAGDAVPRAQSRAEGGAQPPTLRAGGDPLPHPHVPPLGRLLPRPGLRGGHGPRGARCCRSPKAESTPAGQEPPQPAVPKLGVEPEVRSGRDWAELG